VKTAIRHLCILFATLAATPLFAGVVLKLPEGSRFVSSTTSGNSAQSVSFPDVCKTPNAASAPIPYPNMARTESSAFKTGSKSVKGGGKLEFSPVKVRTGEGVVDAVKLKFSDAQGQLVPLDQSTLIELDDGTYCAVCVREGRIAAVLRLVLPTR
jgi:hypothetical protein